MYLLVDTVSRPAAFVFFDSERNVVSIEREDLSGKEFERFLAKMTEGAKKLKTEPKALEGIACVRGPAGFTGIRVVTLTLGTLAFAARIPLFELDYAELHALGGWNGGVLVRANRDEVAHCPGMGKPFEIVRKDSLPPGKYRGSVDESDFAGGAISVESETDYARAVRSLDLSKPLRKIEPFYVKKPNVT